MAVPDVASGQGTVSSPAALSTNLLNSASYTDGRNNTTRFELDSQRRVTKQIDPLNRTTIITRDPQGNPLTITDADNKVTRFFYNAQGLLTETRDALYPANPATTFTYDTLGRLLTTTDPLNRTTTLTYDNAATSTPRNTPSTASPRSNTMPRIA